MRASVPIALSEAPPFPIRIPFCSPPASPVSLAWLLRLQLASRAGLPAVAGALALEAKDISGIPAEQLMPIVLGSVVSFVVGLAALSVLFRVSTARGRSPGPRTSS